MLTRKHAAFTLVEVLIVVIILGILAAAIMPAFSNASDDARSSSVLTIVKGIQRYAETQKIRTGSYPTTFSTTDFQGVQLPTNPYDTNPATPATSANTFEVVTSGSHPSGKVVGSGITPFWYNSATGVVRARVTAGVNDAATIVTYNAANGTAITTLSQTN